MIDFQRGARPAGWNAEPGARKQPPATTRAAPIRALRVAVTWVTWGLYKLSRDPLGSFIGFQLWLAMLAFGLMAIAVLLMLPLLVSMIVFLRAEPWLLEVADGAGVPLAAWGALPFLAVLLLACTATVFWMPVAFRIIDWIRAASVED